MAFLRLWLTANLVIALYNFVNALLTTGNQKLYPSHDWNRERKNREQPWQRLDSGEGTEGSITFCLAGGGMGVARNAATTKATALIITMQGALAMSQFRTLYTSWTMKFANSS